MLFDDDIIGIISIGECSPEQQQSLIDFTDNLVFVGMDILSAKYDSVSLDFDQAVSSVVNFLLKQGIGILALSEDLITAKHYPIILLARIRGPLHLKKNILG